MRAHTREIGMALRLPSDDSLLTMMGLSVFSTDGLAALKGDSQPEHGAWGD